MTDIANEAQIRAVAETVGRAAATIAIQDFVTQHPTFGQPPAKPEIPAPLKWAGGIIAALMTAAIIALAIWMVSTLNELQLTVARMDERQQHDLTGKRLDAAEQRDAKIEERVAKLEERVK